MTAALSVKVTPDLDALTRKLKSGDLAGGRVLKNALAREMRKVGDQVVAAEKQSIAGTTIRGVKGSSRSGKERYKRGGRGRGSGKGVRGPIAAAIKKRNRMTGKEVGVEIRVSGSAMPSGMAKIPFDANTRGFWRHPIFGNRNAWAQQNVSPRGWWIRGYNKAAPQAQAAILAAMHDVEAKFDAL